MIIQSHQFDKRVIQKRVTSTSNVSGQVKPVLVNYDEFWARLQYREEKREVNGKVESVVQRPVFSARRNDDIKKTDILECEGKEYRIDSAIPTDNGEYTIIRAYIDDTK